MIGKTTSDDELETLASRLIEKYPAGFLSEIEIGWPCAIAIRVPEGGCLDTPRAIIRGSYQEVRSFEIAYEKARGAYNHPSFEINMGNKVAVEA